MEADAILGIVVGAAALSLLAGLVLWSRRAIERIAARGSRSAREIVRDLRDEG